MDSSMRTDEYMNGVLGDYFEKTAGDMVQSFWCRLHLITMGDCFQESVYQAAIAVWLNLSHAMLPNKLAWKVQAWAQHPLADFQEMATLYMPNRLVNLYLNVSTNFFLRFIKDASFWNTCQHRRGDQGLMLCDKMESGYYTGYCSMTCRDASKKMIALADFDGTAYGEDYVTLLKRDVVTMLDHSQNCDQWSFAINLRTRAVGWVPTIFMKP
jgi:hypothetical protein